MKFYFGLKNESRVVLKCSFKGGLSQKVFHLYSNLSKKVPNHYPEHYSRKEKMLRIVSGTLFWRFESK